MGMNSSDSIFLKEQTLMSFYIRKMHKYITRLKVGQEKNKFSYLSKRSLRIFVVYLHLLIEFTNYQLLF